MIRDTGVRRQPTHAATNMGAQQPLGGEQRHLGIVGDSPCHAVGWDKVANTARTKPSHDLTVSHKLNRSPEGIPHGATDQAAVEAFAHIRGGIHRGT